MTFGRNRSLWFGRWSWPQTYNGRFLKTAVNGSDDLKMGIFQKSMNKKFDFMYNQLRGGKFNSRIYIPISLRGCYEIATNSTYLFHFYESLRLVSNTLYK